MENKLAMFSHTKQGQTKKGFLVWSETWRELAIPNAVNALLSDSGLKIVLPSSMGVRGVVANDGEDEDEREDKEMKKFQQKKIEVKECQEE